MWIRGVCESEGVLVLFEGQSEEVWKVEHTGQEQTTEGMDGWMDGEYLASRDESSDSGDSGRVGGGAARSRSLDEVGGEAWWLKSRM